MPLSSGIPLGLLVAFLGAILYLAYLATKHKKAATALFTIGLTITIGTVALIGLALSSM